MQPELTFREEDHTYWFQGRRIPNVTSVLSPVMSWEHIPADMAEYGKALGHAVHKACELSDEGTLDESSLHEDVIPRLQAYRTAVIDLKPQWLGIEERVFCPRYKYAGTLDRRGWIDYMGERVYSLIDIKCGTDHPGYDLQLAAYAHVAPSEGLPPPRRFILRLLKDRTYRLIERLNKQATDFGIFVALLKVTQWKEAHK